MSTVLESMLKICWDWYGTIGADVLANKEAVMKRDSEKINARFDKKTAALWKNRELEEKRLASNEVAIRELRKAIGLKMAKLDTSRREAIQDLELKRSIWCPVAIIASNRVAADLLVQEMHDTESYDREIANRVKTLWEFREVKKRQAKVVIFPYQSETEETRAIAAQFGEEATIHYLPNNTVGKSVEIGRTGRLTTAVLELLQVGKLVTFDAKSADEFSRLLNPKPVKGDKLFVYDTDGYYQSLGTKTAVMSKDGWKVEKLGYAGREYKAETSLFVDDRIRALNWVRGTKAGIAVVAYHQQGIVNELLAAGWTVFLY